MSETPDHFLESAVEIDPQTEANRTLNDQLRRTFVGGRVVANWHATPREDTQVLGQSRGSKTDMRMSPDRPAAVVELCGLPLERVVDLLPYHYGAVFRWPH
jgi:hypothetical protein